MGPQAHGAQGDALSAEPPDGEPPAADGGRTVTGSSRNGTRRREVARLGPGADLADLVALAREGDRDAFDELVRATYVDTYTLAHRLTGNDDDARDVVQEAYLRAFRAIRRFRGDAQFSTWMYRITANCAATHLGRRTRHRHDELHDDLDSEEIHPSRDPVLRAESAVDRDRLKEALRRLPPKLRAVVVLRDVYDLPHEAIAAELGISETAAKVRLHRARRKLREDLHPLAGRAEGPPDEEVDGAAV
jgi:RNA polymerase sigma-70 factor (ECF subfamily)